MRKFNKHPNYGVDHKRCTKLMKHLNVPENVRDKIVYKHPEKGIPANQPLSRLRSYLLEGDIHRFDMRYYPLNVGVFGKYTDVPQEYDRKTGWNSTFDRLLYLTFYAHHIGIDVEKFNKYVLDNQKSDTLSVTVDTIDLIKTFEDMNFDYTEYLPYLNHENLHENLTLLKLAVDKGLDINVLKLLPDSSYKRDGLETSEILLYSLVLGVDAKKVLQPFENEIQNKYYLERLSKNGLDKVYLDLLGYPSSILEEAEVLLKSIDTTYSHNDILKVATELRAQHNDLPVELPLREQLIQQLGLEDMQESERSKLMTAQHLPFNFDATLYPEHHLNVIIRNARNFVDISKVYNKDLHSDFSERELNIYLITKAYGLDPDIDLIRDIISKHSPHYYVVDDVIDAVIGFDPSKRPFLSRIFRDELSR